MDWPTDRAARCLRNPSRTWNSLQRRLPGDHGCMPFPPPRLARMVLRCGCAWGRVVLGAGGSGSYRDRGRLRPHRATHLLAARDGPHLLVVAISGAERMAPPGSSLSCARAGGACPAAVRPAPRCCMARPGHVVFESIPSGVPICRGAARLLVESLWGPPDERPRTMRTFGLWLITAALGYGYYAAFLPIWPVLGELGRMHQVALAPPPTLAQLVAWFAPLVPAVAWAAGTRRGRRRIGSHPEWRLMAILLLSQLGFLAQFAVAGHHAVQPYHFNRGCLAIASAAFIVRWLQSVAPRRPPAWQHCSCCRCASTSRSSSSTL
jgi:hypothetical protein